MFKIYDLNMKEIPFPDGVMPLEIFVGSIGKERYTDKAEGRNGVLDYGFNYTDRPVSLFLRIKAADKIDFRLLRNEVFATFDVGSAFYVAESDVPSRVLKVVVDESYIPDRLTEEYADFDINCRTLDSVFWETKYTTLELHESGYSATAEKYGLVDNIDDEKVKYRFEPDLKKVTLKASDFEQGSIASSSGANAANAAEIRMVSYFDTVPGETLTFKDDINGDNINYWWLFEYDKNGGYLGFYNTPLGGNGELKFVAKGHRLRVRSNSYNGIKPADVGVQTLPTLEGIGWNNNFTVYNAGNVTVEPESMPLNIFISGATTTNGELILKNNTTGDEFKLNRNITNRHIQLDNLEIKDGTINIFRQTNRRFISLAPGDNHFTITGATFNFIRFIFKFYYK